MTITILWRALPGALQQEARDAFLRCAFGNARFARLRAEAGGKPYLMPAAEDLCPPHISIAHTQGLIACAMADAPVGLDTERLHRRVAPALARRILSAPEQAAYAALPEAARGAFLLRRWVVKEAHLKRTGEGLAGGMARLTVADDGRVEDAAGHMLSRFTTLTLSGCLLAVASEAPLEGAFPAVCKI